ncbi:MAG: hypothetical protein F4059_03390, partial [Gemmatimonadetes bacterium]|nr:hypothetical protein [Gemmatimonadota bacterium]
MRDSFDMRSSKQLADAAPRRFRCSRGFVPGLLAALAVLVAALSGACENPLPPEGPAPERQIPVGPTVLLTDHSGAHGYPAWSPDGTRIAYLSSRSGDTFRPDLYVMDAAGGGETRLTSSQAVVPGFLVWSPDGSRIA